ncbi:MAG: hypothetical protein V1816_20460 [Pseudomonadota bacterium]
MDVGYSETKLVKMKRVSDRKWELLDYVIVSHAPDLKLDSPEMVKLLRTNLDRMIGTAREARIWTIVTSTKVEMRYLRIPKLPKKQVANAVFWTFKKDVPFKDDESVFDFDVLGEVSEEGAKKIEVVAYAAPRDEIETLAAAFSRVGHRLSGVTTVPAAIQNFFRTSWLDVGPENACSIFVGRNWSRIDIYSRGNLVLSRGVKAGVNSMIEAIYEEISRISAEMSLELFDELDNPVSLEGDSLAAFSQDDARNLLLSMADEAPVLPSHVAGVPISETEILDMISPALERMARQVERTLEHYAINFRGERISRVFVSGLAATLPPFMTFMARQLNVPFQPLDPFKSGAPVFLSPQGAVSVPGSMRERLSCAPTVGLALGDNTITPNFLFTYKDEEKTARAKTVQRIVFSALTVIMVFLAGVFFWQEATLKQAVSRRKAVEASLAQYKPLVDKEQVLAQIARKNLNRKALADYGRRYVGLAALTLLVNSTPRDVKLIEFKLNLGPAGTDGGEGAKPADGKAQGVNEKGPAAAAAFKKTVLIQGLVLGDEQKQDVVLSQYLLKLESHPLFSNPSVVDKTRSDLDGKNVVRFSARLDVN